MVAASVVAAAAAAAAVFGAVAAGPVGHTRSALPRMLGLTGSHYPS